MEKIKIEVLNAGGEVLAEYSGSEEAAFVYDRPYCEGDRIRIEAEPKNSFWWIQVDDAVGKSMVYLTGAMEYVIPFGCIRTIGPDTVIVEIQEEKFLQKF